MPKYRIPYEWTVSGEIEVEASNLQDAVDIVHGKPLAKLEHSDVSDSFFIRRDVVQEFNPHVSEEEMDNTIRLED